MRQRQQFVWGCNCAKDAGDLILIPTPGGTIIKPILQISELSLRDVTQLPQGSEVSQNLHPDIPILGGSHTHFK